MPKKFDHLVEWIISLKQAVLIYFVLGSALLGVLITRSAGNHLVSIVATGLIAAAAAILVLAISASVARREQERLKRKSEIDNDR